MISEQSPLVLGSASPRRKQLLEELAIPVVVRPVTVDESSQPGEDPEAYVTRVVDLKLGAAMEQPDLSPEGVVLVADTTVTIDSRILGKPTDCEDAVRLLRQIVGRTHQVLTRYAFAHGGECRVARTVATSVSMKKASQETIDRYARTGEGLDKAGAYAIQGIGAFLVQSIAGSHSNVIGLPVAEVVGDLMEAGVLTDFP